MNFEDVKKIVIKENGKPYKLLSNVYTSSITEWLKNNVKGTNNMTAMLCCIAMDLNEVPICKNNACNNYVEFRGTLNKGFSKYCSRKCSAISEDTRSLYRKTSNKNYGVSSPLSSDIVRSKIYDSMINTYGSKTAVQNPEGMNKRKATNLERYGAEENFSLPEVQLRIDETNFLKYGVKRPCQQKDVKLKMLASRKIRTLTYKNTDLYYQSKLEYLFLELAETYNFINEIKNGLTFNYNFDNDNKIYVTDFFIPKFNMIIEIKSKWTYNNHGANKKLEEKNHLKWKTVENSGYNMKVLIDKPNIVQFYNNLNNLYVTN